MKFNTIKEMKVGLMKITSLKDLQEDINYSSQGRFITAKYLNTGKSALNKEVVYMSDETIDSVRIEFEGDNNNITVSKVAVTID
jgi:hypothetical protein